MYPFTINMLIATIWLLLSSQPGVSSFVIGFLTGYAILALFRKLLPGGEAYVRRSLALLRFSLHFSWQFVVANFSVARTVLFHRTADLRPGFVACDVSALKPGEILLLTYCITLTPGTVSIKLADDFGRLIVHALDARDPDAIRRDINRQIVQPMLAFTR